MYEDEVLNLLDQYYDYIVSGNTNYPKAKIIVFKLIEDANYRNGLGNEWDSYDKFIKIEILETWVDIVEKMLND